MQVILRENIENLGKTGDVVKVSDGYARNFLLPRKLVMIAEEKNIAAIEQAKKALEKKRLAEKASAQEFAAKLSGLTCVIARKVGEHDKLFGSVSTTDISEALKQLGHNLDRRYIQLETPIKTLGVHSVTIKLEPEVSAVIQVSVVKE